MSIFATSRRRRPRSAGRSAVLALPLLPAVALLVSPWLPIVNTTRLWLGVPALFIWTALWVLLVTPAMLTVERVWARPRERNEEVQA